MQKIHHHLKTIIKSFTLTTPVAILLGAVIISGGLMGYGYITTNNSSNNSANPLPKILKSIKVKEKAFTECVNSEKASSTVALSLKDGVQAGVNGTPSTFILVEKDGVQYVVGDMIVGNPGAEFIQQMINEALSPNSGIKLQPFKGKPITSADLQESTTPTNVYIVEYSDAECPYCIGLHSDMKKIRTDNTGKISFVYRNFPLPPYLHKHAKAEAQMIFCAGELGGAKGMYRYLDETFDWKAKNNIGFMTLESK
jgi:protein-disulfide isomerase